MGRKLKNIIHAGDTYNQLTALYPIGTRRGEKVWLFQCQCGQTKDIVAGQVIRGITKGCGCMRKNAPEDFWSKVDRRADDQCWEWQGGGYSTSPYGHAQYNNKDWGAHRLAYFLTFGEIPQGMFVCHKCDNPPCCNPSHLFLGTALDNSQDCISKGRQKIVPPPVTLGEQSPHHILTEIQVREIKRLLALGVSQRKIAKLFGISQTNVGHINRGETWAHVSFAQVPSECESAALALPRQV